MGITDEGVISDLRDELRNTQWTYLHHSLGDYSDGIHVWSVLADPQSAAEALKQADWVTSAGDGNPTYSYSLGSNNSIKDIQYYPLEKVTGYEPLIFKATHHHPMFIEKWEFSQSARLLLGLWFDSNDGNLYTVNESAETEMAVEFCDNFVRIRTYLLEILQGIRGKVLLQQFEVTKPLTQHSVATNLTVMESDNGITIRYFGNDSDTYIKRFQAVRGIFSYKPMPPEQAIELLEGTETIEKNFIVGKDSHNRDIVTSAEVSKLNNNFDVNPGAFHYLYPVFFKRDVLTRYVQASERFALDSGFLKCGSIWSLEFDDGYEDLIMVWLGDLGSRLPSSEYHHWRQHNVAASVEISKNKVLRDIFGQWTFTENIFQSLELAKANLQNAWSDAFSVNFFKPLDDFNKQRLATLTYPTNTSLTGIRNPIEKLALMVIECINTAYLPSLKNDTGSINRLSKFLEDKGVANPNGMVSNLRSLYQFRSKAGAHIVGTEGRELIDRLIANNAVKKNFSDLVITVTRDLEELCQFALAYKLNQE